MNNKHLHSIFAALPSSSWLLPRGCVTPERAAKLAKRQEQELAAIARSRVIIAASPDVISRQRIRRATYGRTFADISIKYAMPRKIRRAITHDKLKIDRAAVKRAAA